MTRPQKKVSKSNDDQLDALARAALASASGYDYDRDLGISIMAATKKPSCTKESESAS